MSAVASNQVQDPLYHFYGFLKNSYILGYEPLTEAMLKIVSERQPCSSFFKQKCFFFSPENQSQRLSRLSKTKKFYHTFIKF